MPLAAALSLGFVFAFAHCLGMCGGIVAAYSGTLPEGRSWWPHVLYNLGRALSYMALGAIAGGVGSAVALGGQLAGFQGALSLVAGTVMILLGLGFLGWKVLDLEAALLLGGTLWYRTLFARVLAWPLAWRTLGVGVLNGLLPCGLVYAGLALAAGTGHPGPGALVMGAFALGTMPAMLLLGLVAYRLGVELRRRLQLLGAVLLVLAGALTVWRAFG